MTDHEDDYCMKGFLTFPLAFWTYASPIFISHPPYLHVQTINHALTLFQAEINIQKMLTWRWQWAPLQICMYEIPRHRDGWENRKTDGQTKSNAYSHEPTVQYAQLDSKIYQSCISAFLLLQAKVVSSSNALEGQVLDILWPVLTFEFWRKRTGINGT